MQELEEKVNDVLLSFIDFLYAVVFGLIVSELFDKVFFVTEKTIIEKITSFLLVLGVFYFLLWDWLHGRLLTLKNPYKRYGRFFIELIIAFCGYGAALQVTKASVSFLAYIVIILLLGAVWAHWTIREYPDSSDKVELELIRLYQPFQVVVISGLVAYWYFLITREMNILSACAFLFFEWLFFLQYEFLLERPSGITAGPGVPFMNKQRIDKFSNFMIRFVRFFTRR